MANKPKRRWETMDKSNTELTKLMLHFEVHNRTEGKSPRTVEWYNDVLGLLSRWLESEGIPATLGNLDEMVIRRFILYLQSRPGCKGPVMSSHSIANRVRALRAFFAWLAHKGYTEYHLLQDLKQPLVTDLTTEPLTQVEIDQVFSAVNPNTALGARNSAIISIMLDTGLRVSEAANLKAADLHLEDQYVKVLGKGGKERIVSFGTTCQRALLQYYHYFRSEPAHAGVNTFFLSIDGYPLSAVAVQSFIKRLAKTSGIPRLHPHLLRHTYATLFILNGGDIFLLKQNLGHSTLVMVLHYLHIAAQTAAVRSKGFSPLDRLNVRDGRQYRHSFRPAGEGTNGQVYPHAGRLGGKKRRSPLRRSE